MVAIAVLKIADFAMFSALSRGFNPVADLAPAGAGMRLLAGAIAPPCGRWPPLPPWRWRWRHWPPGAAFTARVGVERLGLARGTLAGLGRFRAAAAADPFAGAVGLLDRIDRDAILVFVESHGRTGHDTPLLAGLHRRTLAEGEARRAAPGLAGASGFLASPTRAGKAGWPTPR